MLDFRDDIAIHVCAIFRVIAIGAVNRQRYVAHRQACCEDRLLRHTVPPVMVLPLGRDAVVCW
jgi:hypothetical protein